MNEDTFISVIMGVRYRRNDITLLRRAVDSILSQSVDDFEFIICEKESTSDAKELLANYAKSDQRIILLDGTDTGSFSEQLNKCLYIAKGQFIARMDDDDYSFPERFRIQMDFLKKHNEYDFVGSQCVLECDGTDIGCTSFPETPQVKDFLFSQPYIHPSLIFRRKVLDTAEGYSQLPRCERCEDYDLLLRLYELGFKGYNIKEPCFRYTLPTKRIINCKFHYRLNEAKTRFVRFSSLGLMPKAFFYAIKPVIIGLISPKIIAKIKSKKDR